MYLKALEIKGFKSFMDKTYISFPKGMISIVGPNGSGKSNILDAIRWVLGEQSIKSLRGDKLEDVIFSGTQKRSPMGYCEVTLILDNIDKTAEIEYSELAIKRKAYKSGESQFFLNGKRCRLKDIKELLLDTGIGKEGYSIISQGKIDEIISSNSAQKRALLEEASGITKFRYKKMESEKNLEQSNENLDRIKDIFFEIEKQIKPLEAQKIKAEKYLDYSNKLKIQEINKNLRVKNQLDNQLDELRKKADSFRSEEEDKKTDISKKQKKLSDNEKDLETVSANRQKLYIEKSDKQKEISLNIKSQELKEKEIQNLNSTNELLQEQFDDSKKQIEETKRNLEDLKNEIQEKTKVKEEFIKQTQNFEIEEKNLIDEIQNHTIKLKEKEQKYRSVENEIAKLETRMDFQNKNIESFKERFEEYDNIQKDYKIKIEKADEEIEEKNNEIEKENKNIKELTENLRENLTKIENIETETLNLDNAISKQSLKLKDISTQNDMLEKFENEMQGFSKGIKSILKEKSLKGIENVVANVIKVKQGYEKAIEQLLGGRLENIIIENSSDAKAAIEYLKEKKLGRATFLPMDTIKSSSLNYNDKGVKAIDVVEFDKKYFDIISNLLGRMVIVEDMDTALEISKKYNHSFRLATKSGEIFNVGGSITGGSSHFSKEIFSRRNSIEQNKKIIKQLNLEIEKLQEDKKNINEEKLEIKKQNQVIQQNSDSYNQKLEVLKRQYYTLSSKKENIQDSLNKLLEEKQMVTDSNEKAKQSYKKDSKDLEEKNSYILNLEKEIEEVKKDLENSKSNKEEISLKLNQINTNLSLILQDIKNISEKIQDIETVIESNSEKSDIAKDKIEKNIQKIQKNKTDIENLKQNLEKIEIELENIDKNFSIIDKKENEINIEIKALKEEIEKLTQIQNKTMQEKLKIENDIEKINYKLNILEENLIQSYSVNFEQALEFKDDNLEVDKNIIKSLRQSIDSLGNVNLDAIEEFKNVNQRYIFYKEQKEDLEESISKIGLIIKQLEKTMVENFKESFKTINSNFSDIFKILFGGGSAKLVLLDENNVLESDIEISVHPPGKKLRTISMLSGGEKALCAIALLFAIIAKKPVPFCILDEIDAPLDDANIYRYIGYLSTLSDTTQFITITHRRGTMEESDYIYGVTMQEKGVSNIVSLKLEDAKDFVED